MIEDQFVTLAQQAGFPVVAFMLMYKLATDTIKENTAAIQKLNEAVTRLCVHEEETNN